MSVEKKVKEFTDLWEQLDNMAPTNTVAVRPANSFTPEEFAKRRGLSRVQANAILLQMYRDGKLKRVRYQHRWHYMIA